MKTEQFIKFYKRCKISRYICVNGKMAFSFPYGLFHVPKRQNNILHFADVFIANLIQLTGVNDKGQVSEEKQKDVIG